MYVFHVAIPWLEWASSGMMVSTTLRSFSARLAYSEALGKAENRHPDFITFLPSALAGSGIWIPSHRGGGICTAAAAQCIRLRLR